MSERRLPVPSFWTAQQTQHRLLPSEDACLGLVHLLIFHKKPDFNMEISQFLDLSAE